MAEAPKRGYLGPRSVEGYDPAIDRMSDRIDELEAEIERLRANLEEAYDACRYALADSPRWRENAATVVAEWEARRG